MNNLRRGPHDQSDILVVTDGLTLQRRKWQSRRAVEADHGRTCQQVVQGTFLPGKRDHQKATTEKQQREHPIQRAKQCPTIGHLLPVNSDDLQAKKPLSRRSEEHTSELQSPLNLV